MDPDKDSELIKSYNEVLQIGFYDRHMDDLELFFSDDFMFYGTGLDEKGLSREQFRELILRIREQGESIEVQISKSPVQHSYLNGQNSAIFIDEIKLDIIYDGSSYEINIRHTIIFDKPDNHWKAIHIHASVAYDFQPEGNSWPIEEMKKKNMELEALVNQRTAELNQSLLDLKTTQDQLVHSEKMASLGELTSGIAHEIQNPLNFINNFSDVNSELLEELLEFIQKRDMEDALLTINDIKQNMTKITEHGLRADSIVKSMQLHNQRQSKETEKINLHELIEEYSRIAFFSKVGNSENQKIELRFEHDPSIPVLVLNVSELGRTMVSMINNALDSVLEKAELVVKDFTPEVIVSTQNNSDNIIICVSDNGLGVDPKIRDKIFQPFFTTKPTGKGIGLGLSLAYDTITKVYGGELILNTSMPNTQFIIKLPKSNLVYN